MKLRPIEDVLLHPEHKAELATLRAEVERLTRERDEAKSERDEALKQKQSLREAYAEKGIEALNRREERDAALSRVGEARAEGFREGVEAAVQEVNCLADEWLVWPKRADFRVTVAARLRALAPGKGEP